MKYLGALVAFPIAMLLAMGMNWIALFRFPSEAIHWTLRARKLYPIRQSAALNIWLIPAAFGMVQVMSTEAREPLLSFALILSAWAGAIMGTYSFDKKLFPQFSFRLWLRCAYGGWVMRFGVWGVLIAGGVLMPEDFGWPLVLLGGVIIALQAGLHFGLWIWMLKATGLLVRAKGPEPVCDIVWRTSECMQVPYRTIWILRNPVGYAAALPTTHDLIFSEGLLASHPEEEIAAICAHELAHLSEPRRLVIARVLGAMSLCPLIFIRPMVHAFDFGGIVTLLLPFALATVYSRRLGRRMEVRADEMAKQNTAEAGVYARALERLYRVNQMPAVMPGKHQIHPHLYDRLLAAGVTPDYPRPEPPDTLFWTSGLMYVVLAILFFVMLTVNLLR